ncbi:polysaccharide pyruvyl transferase family protein [Pseudorhodoferax soli]|uniref:Pyruvyl transferase EpsO n=1 Tax=Pseudorhodoferax soli TaxID=545864 RepID=A0A368Y6W6_9BURK|nr:polysaccharide pyruvyl transferase family protein [Pseudorhodoferax soli]RCW76031.1 pyruvyl transferase EpsO [Pseudorhodoferax soli]
MQPQTSREYIAAMQGKIHDVLGPLIGKAPMAIVDFPDIRNVGDSAIWLGEIAYLKQHYHKSPDYVSKIEDFSDRQLERKVPQGPIFIHGGGNFGDIWVSHQNFRERILKRWPDRLIVQFPQSIHYDSDARVEESARVIAKHKNFVLLVRDQESLEFARKRFDCEVKLCPDMAFCIGTLDAMPPPSIPLLAMLREDKEKVASRDGTAELDCPVEDWIKEPKLPVRWAKTLGTMAAISTLDRIAMRKSMFDAAAAQRFGRGTRQLARARAIVTDRLHVHIVSLLMGKPHAVLDNSYGKITRFMDAFPGGMDLTYRARSLQDGMQWAREQAASVAGVAKEAAR